MIPPRLESERLIVQPLNPADADTLFAYRSHPNVAKFQSWHPENELETLQFIQSHEGLDFGIPDTWFQLGVHLKPDIDLIGDIGLHFLKENPKTVEIGYTIAPAHQRKGYASESVSGILAYLFTVLQPILIIAVTDPQNHPSIKFLALLGFEKTAPESLPFTIEMLPEDVLFTLSPEKWAAT